MNTIKDYLNRFDFRKTPFTRELAVEDHFAYTTHVEVERHLNRAIEERISAALIAPVSCGKTTVLHNLLAGLGYGRYSAAPGSGLTRSAPAGPGGHRHPLWPRDGMRLTLTEKTRGNL